MDNPFERYLFLYHEGHDGSIEEELIDAVKFLYAEVQRLSGEVGRLNGLTATLQPIRGGW